MGQCFVSYRKPASAIAICEQGGVTLYVTDEMKCWNRAEFYSSVKPPASDQSDDSIWCVNFLLMGQSTDVQRQTLTYCEHYGEAK